MKTIKIYLSCLILTIFFYSCELDNYENPNATLYGSFVDIETNELVEQDIINGTKIVIIESGFETPQEQFLVVKNDGTYRNTMLFSNLYTIQPKRGNFTEVEAQEIDVRGETKLDFMVLPYIRIKNVNVYNNGAKIKATFNLQQTGFDDIQKIGLYIDKEPTVGEPKHIVKKELAVGSRVDDNQLFTIEINMLDYPLLKNEQSYFFRVGALINVPEAKFNYAKAVTLKL